MATIYVPQVSLVPRSAGDLDLLRKTNMPAMTEHLGGPETEEQLVARHRRYLDPEANRDMFRVVLPAGEVVGSTGYWDHEWHGEPAHETGFGILPEFQGRGLAVAAVMAVVGKAKTVGRHRLLHAFPSIDHIASNVINADLLAFIQG